MKLLLDTHIWIWSVADKKRLSKKVVVALQSPRNELWLSPISIWELLVLAEKGNLLLDRPAERWIAAAFEVSPLRDAPLTREVAIESRRLEMSHQDPADRFIAATAQIYQLTLVSGDARMLGIEGVAILPNR